MDTPLIQFFDNKDEEKQTVELLNKQIKEAKTDAKYAKIFAIGALMLTAIFGFPDLCEYIDNHFNPETVASNNKLKESIQQLSQLQLSNKLLDSVNQALILQLHFDTLNNKYLETINKSLITLNNNIKFDKK